MKDVANSLATPLVFAAWNERRWYSVALTAVGVSLLTLSAKTQIPAWPVPMTMQSYVVLVIGMAYGTRLGVAIATAMERAWASVYPLPVRSRRAHGNRTGDHKVCQEINERPDVHPMRRPRMSHKTNCAGPVGSGTTPCSSPTQIMGRLRRAVDRVVRRAIDKLSPVDVIGERRPLNHVTIARRPDEQWSRLMVKA